MSMTQTDISRSEACAVLNVSDEALALVMSGPFSPDADGAFHCRQLLGAATVLQLEPMVGATAAARIAVTVAAQAQTDDPHRVMAVGWRQGAPLACWLNEITPDFETALLVLPPDLWLSQIHDALLAHRAASAAPH